MQHPSFTADRNWNYSDFYGVLATVNPYCLVLPYCSLASCHEVKQNKQKILIHFSSAILFMRPVKLDVRGGYILSQTYKRFRRVSEKTYWGMKVKLLCIIILRREKKLNYDGLLFLFIKKDLFDLIGFILFAERERTGSNYTGNKANSGSWFVVSWKKCPLINQSVSSRHFVEDSYGASFQGRNPSQFRRS